MTDTLTTQPAPAGTLPEGVEFCFTAPADLLLDVNVRSELALTPEFRASIRDLGVLVPIVAVRTREGLRVQKGQRRAVAAAEEGVTQVPVYIVPGTDDAQRIIEQLAENHHRAAMTATDDANAFGELALLGKSVAQIAKATHRSKSEVTAGLAVAKSSTATQATADYALDLLDGALFAEFADDEDATSWLTETAERGWSLAHTAQRIRDKRAEQAAIDAMTAELTDIGVTITSRPCHYDQTVREFSALRAKGSKDPFTLAEHASCPGHAAWIDYDNNTARAVFVCTDYKAHGHLPWVDPSETTERVPLSDEERAERRQVRENNAAWRSAETVRREWLPRLAARKTPPRGAAEFVAQIITTHPDLLVKASFGGMCLAGQLLGSKKDLAGLSHVQGLLAKANASRSQVITLVVVAAAIEESTGVHSWRRTQHASAVKAYLTALESWGYQLSDIEATTCGRKPSPAQPAAPANAA